MLKVDHLSKSFGGRNAVDGVTFTVRQGDVAACLGPNGAGKSTTMRMIAGVLEPDAGDVEIAGQSILSQRSGAQASLGYLPEGAPLYADLTPTEFLAFIAHARDLPKADRRTAIDRTIADARISSVASKRIGDLSKGYRRRVALAGAILHDPEVLVLDEPTDGLDPHQKQAVRALVARMAPTKAILISTHTLEEVPAMCNRVLVIDRGRIVVDTTPDELAGDGTLERAFVSLTEQADAA